jgi:uncharacterized protein YkwD
VNPVRSGSRRGLPPALAALLAGLLGLAGAAGCIVLLRSLPHGGGSSAAVPAPLYAKEDPWLPYLADERTCPGGEDDTRSAHAEVETMVCLVNYARSRDGLSALPVSATLSESARLKGDEILRCDLFAHSPCGDDPSAGVRGLGYRGSFGENLYIADGPEGALRVALDHWLNSPDHRVNLFRPTWRVQSLYVVKLGRFRQYRGATLWVSHFGDRY